MSKQGTTARRRPSHATVVAYLALFIALGGTAWAAAKIDSGDISRNAVKAKHIRADAVREQELALGSVTGDAVADDSLGGADVDESSLTGVDAETLGGAPPTGYLTRKTYSRTSALGPGTQLVNGYYYAEVGCDAGDIVLNGSPTAVSAPSVLVNSEGTNQYWSATIDKRGGTDTFGVAITCLDQAP